MNETNNKQESIIENRMNDKAQLGLGRGLFGWSISTTRWIYRASLLIGGLFLLFAKSYSPFVISMNTVFSKEVGFLLFMFGLVLYVVYK